VIPKPEVTKHPLYSINIFIILWYLRHLNSNYHKLSPNYFTDDVKTGRKISKSDRGYKTSNAEVGRSIYTSDPRLPSRVPAIPPY